MAFIYAKIVVLFWGKSQAILTMRKNYYYGSNNKNLEKVMKN